MPVDRDDPLPTVYVVMPYHLWPRDLGTIRVLADLVSYRRLRAQSPSIGYSYILREVETIPVPKCPTCQREISDAC